MIFIRLFLIFSIMLASLQSFSQKRTYITIRTGSDINIDGVFDEEAWNLVDWSEGFIQREPHAAQPATQNTKFKIIYDNNYLYCAIRCFDSAPDSIVSRLCRRDAFDGDWVEINIDSYHDLRSAFSFNVNAAGVKGDETVSNDDQWDSSWEPIWYVKTTIDSFGWNAEIKIPFTQLRFGKQDNYIWGFQVNRRLFRKEESSSWQYVSPNATGWVHNFGELHGISNIKPRKQKDITPYIVGGLKSYQRDSDNPFASGKDFFGNVGVDGKFGITNDLTLDFTINPDFGQVEADPSEVNLTTFETKFEERRPFFIEGKSILSYTLTDGGTPMSNDNLFYSRRIGKKPTYDLDLDENEDEYAKYPENTTILGAFKLTGKTKKGWSVGLFESVTQKEVAEIDSAGVRHKQDVEPSTNYLAGRLQKDFNGSNSRIGIILTATNRKLDDPYLLDEMPKEAYSGGFDLFHQWKDKTYYFTVKGAFSTIRGSKNAIYGYQTSSPHYFQRPDASHLRVDSTKTHLEGNGGIFQIGKAGNSRWMYCTWITWRSPGMNLNDEGYMNRNDEIQEIAWIGFRQREPFSIFRNFNANTNQWYGATFGNEKRYVGGNINFSSMFKNYWSLGGGISRDGKSISTETLRGGPSLQYDGITSYWANTNTDYRKKIHFYFNFYSEFRDYGNAEYLSYIIGSNYQATDALKISLEPGYTKRSDKIEYVSTLDDLAVPRYIRGTIEQTTLSMTVRCNFSITPDFSIQLYAMPFISAGKYKDSEFKYITDAGADNFEDQYMTYNASQLKYNSDDEEYEVDENLDGSTDYTFDQPNFNVYDFNANLVIRWEYLPGSTLYLVWSQNRNTSDSNGNFSLNQDTKTLFDTYPKDVVLIKLSYRFGL
jgi:hypothetical protein